MEKDKCCHPNFPALAIVLLILGFVWLLSELKVLVIDIPWWPVILVVLALVWIIKFYAMKNKM